MEARYHLICPSCRKSETRVVDSRDDENVVRRRRECLDCKSRFTTYERMEAPRLFVVKKDGRREQYNRDKVLTGLRRSCEKRPVSEGQMEEVVAGLERELFSRGENEVPTTMLGEKLMEALKRVDEGIKAIRKFLAEYQQQEKEEDCSELRFLVRWRREVERERPLGALERLEKQLELSVELEDYEQAARIRDQIRLLDDSTRERS